MNSAYAHSAYWTLKFFLANFQQSLGLSFYHIIHKEFLVFLCIDILRRDLGPWRTLNATTYKFLVILELIENSPRQVVKDRDLNT